MFKVAYDYKKSWPDNGSLRIESHLALDIPVSPTVAQRKVNGFLAGYVTMMVSAGKPMLVLDEHPVWRVPANLRLPTVGQVSVLGSIDVDAQTGAILVPKTKEITQMQELAHAIAAHFASRTTPTS